MSKLRGGGGGVVLHISKQYGVKIAPMAIKRTFSHFCIAECFLTDIL